MACLFVEEKKTKIKKEIENRKRRTTKGLTEPHDMRNTIRSEGRKKAIRHSCACIWFRTVKIKVLLYFSVASISFYPLMCGCVVFLHCLFIVNKLQSRQQFLWGFLTVFYVRNYEIIFWKTSNGTCTILK